VDIEDWRVDAWICDGNAVSRQVDVATREERLPQQRADLSIDQEVLANHDDRLSRQEGDLVPAGRTSRITAPTRCRRNITSFRAGQTSLSTCTTSHSTGMSPQANPWRQKKKEAPGASRMPPAKIAKNLDFCV
jgi:hypothetical protein